MVSKIVALPPGDEIRKRLPRLLSGLILCGVTFGMSVNANLGLDPWDVFHQGLAAHLGLPIGVVTVGVGVVVLLGWIPLRQRIGLGTIANTLIIGNVMDLVIRVAPTPSGLVTRWAMLVASLSLAGPAIALYIGARLGPGPRDGIMTGLALRGPSIRSVRTGIELTALAAGWALGGTVGIGTMAFAVTVGPNVQFWLDRLDMGHPPGFEPTIDVEVDPDPTLAAN